MLLSLHKVNVAASQGAWCHECARYLIVEVWPWGGRLEFDAGCPSCGTLQVFCPDRRSYWDCHKDTYYDIRPDYFPPPRWIKCCYPSRR